MCQVHRISFGAVLFAIALWDRAVLKGLNPKDPYRAAKRAWPFEGWFLYWSSIFILPLFSEFFLPKTVYPCEVASDEDRPLRVPPVLVKNGKEESRNGSPFD